eukprot:TRINITY_DN1930_c0_g1_i2.p1 TRINITY_DN1930_c0_g1~~TRINITY_DN1930_c0_g1_i2.p1  ORF type:complete len:136 (+),score=4.96 TRINITY_DN1930_c0_g1_i2:103-510(+)
MPSRHAFPLLSSRHYVEPQDTAPSVKRPQASPVRHQSNFITRAPSNTPYPASLLLHPLTPRSPSPATHTPLPRLTPSPHLLKNDINSLLLLAGALKIRLDSRRRQRRVLHGGISRGGIFRTERKWRDDGTGAVST